MQALEQEDAEDCWRWFNDREMVRHLMQRYPISRLAEREFIERMLKSQEHDKVFAIETLDGRPLGLLANYSLHYVGGTGRHNISADYFGVFADRIQQLLDADRLDPPFVGAMSNGASANINNIDYSKPRMKRKPYEQIRLVADQCAQAVFEQYDELVWHDWVPLDMRQRELELGVRKPTPAQLEHAKQVLADPDHHDEFPHERNDHILG